MKRKGLLPMNIQFFATAGTDGGNAGSGSTETQGAADVNNQGQQTAGTQAPAFDYDKLASLINGKQSVTEETVLKNYFKQQGLSEDEVKQAISSFKEQKAKNTPDVNALQTQIVSAQKEAEAARIELEATRIAMSLGIDSKSLPYVLKMADMSDIKDKDGKLDQEKIKTALNKVLTDVPGLKSEPRENVGIRIGAGQSTQVQGQNIQTTAPATKRWNRWN